MIRALFFGVLQIAAAVQSINAAQQGDTELLFVGDAMQHKAQLTAARAAATDGGYNYDSCFELIAPEVEKADLAVVNLELPLGGGPNYSGYPAFSAPDSYAEALRDAGFDLFFTANNHTLDQGDKGLRRTLTTLDRIGVDHLGTYYDKAQRDSLIPFIRDVNGIKIGFLNYTYGTNGITARSGAEVSYIDRKKMADEIARTRAAGAELICVGIHWGIEYQLNENAGQRDLADYLVNQGVDMIIGGHPHVVQPMKVVHNAKEDKDVLVVYSLGNFISNMTKPNSAGGALVKAIVGRDSEGRARFKSAVYDTFFTERPTGNKSNFRVVPASMSDKLPTSQQRAFRQFDSTARRLFDKYNVKVPAAPR